MGTPLRDQSNGNKSYILALGHHFETKATATNRTSWNWGTTSRPKQRTQIVHLSIGAPLRDQSNGNKSYILALGHYFETKATSTNRTSWNWGTTSRPKPLQQIAHLNIGAPLRDQSNGNKSYILALGHHLEAKATATNRTSWNWGTTSRPKQRQQIVHAPKPRQQIAHLSIGAPLRDQSNGNKSYILALGHHLEAKATSTNRTSWNWGTTSRPKPLQQIAHLNIGAPLRDQSNGSKSYILASGHRVEAKSNGNKSYILAWGRHFEAKATATNRTS